jgi:SAM-dependent methyltransferase
MNDSHHSNYCERIDPTTLRDLESAKHWARYDWACQFMPARRVLDCASGSGFGSALLAQRGANEVIGVDRSSDAITAARGKFGRDNVTFVQADAMTLSRDQIGGVDRIVCLETLEHVAEPQRLLDIFAGLLEPEGLLLVSVPNDTLLGSDNPFHLWRAERETIHGWLSERFDHVTGYAEIQVIGCSIRPLSRASTPPPAGEAPQGTYNRVLDTLPERMATGHLFACGAKPAPLVADVSTELLDGVAYIRELEQHRQQLWVENQQFANGWSEQDQLCKDQKARIAELEAELERVWAEARRLSDGWQKQKDYIDQQEQELSELRTRSHSDGHRATNEAQR